MRLFLLASALLLAAPVDDPNPGGGGGGGGGKTPPNLTPGDPPKDTPKGDDKAPDKGVETISMPKEAFDERLTKAAEAAQRKFLKSLGFDKAEDLQTVLTTAKTLQDEKKTEKERLEGKLKELEPKAAKADTLSKRFESLVSAEFDKLDEKVQAAIDKVADGDAEKRWEQIEVLRASGLLTAGPEKPKAPATKSAGGAPPPREEGAKTKFTEWNELRKTNPVRASLFYQSFAPAIEASRPADDD